MLIIFNWITIQSIILHSILFNFGSVHICENSNKLGRITSQSKVENKMALYRTAAMIFTAILDDLEARRKAREASKARRRNIRCLKQQQRMRQFSNTFHRPFLGLFCPIRASCCAWRLTYVALPLYSIKRLNAWFPQTTTCPPFCSITHCNYFKQPQGVGWSNCNPIIIRDCN